MAIPRFWPETNLTMYGIFPTHAIIFNISDGVESVNLGLLVKFHAQLIGFTAWKFL